MSATVLSLPPTPLPDNDRLRRARDWFDRLRDEGGADLPAFSPEPIDDPNLSDSQKHAVGRAVATPDVFLLESDYTSGRTLAASIARHAAQRGERVLLVVPENELTNFDTQFPMTTSRGTCDTPAPMKTPPSR